MGATVRGGFAWKASLPYLTPFVLFILITAGGEPLAGAWYPAVYVVKIVIVCAALIVLRHSFEELRSVPTVRALMFGLVVGMLVFALWVWVESRRFVPPLPFGGKRAAYNPFDSIESVAARAAFIAVRLFGMVAVVPVMEELLWRSWMLRILVREDFKRVPLGKFTVGSCLISAAMFSLTHPEWLSAFLTGLAYNMVIYHTKNLWVCIVAHATTNLALGIYVLATGSWELW